MVNPEDPALLDLGTIEVRIFRVNKEKPTGKPIAPNTPTERGPVHERCKKAGTHHVSYGEATKIEKRQYYKPTWIDPQSQPYATFRLRYRPRELLRARGIIVDRADIHDEPSSSGSHPSADTAETYESDSDVVVLDGPPSKKRRINSSTSVDVKPTIDVDALDADGTDDTGDDLDVATIAEQIRSLTKQLERKLRKKKRTVTGARGKKAKKEKLEEIDVHLG
ncbi:hypothetical protein SCP_0213560 [Sparassis crispa]|uniref:DUF7918 domain-containing protein n=1 Tax=Sparassis crispa TaxID=139825 RepID=A0A401GDF5_9APHY|nr:hypothetical protein SCP_0213560 [Sparassis crispa]GBE80153.1 hypothetical protein SCP_0213560 [Sparassis crispa]